MINFDDSNWRKLDLFYDWSIEGKFEKNNLSEGDGGFYLVGKVWYRKIFFVLNEWVGNKVFIYFEGVYMNVEIFINGKLIGVQFYGYIFFEYDFLFYLKFGEKNIIVVKVDNF